MGLSVGAQHAAPANPFEVLHAIQSWTQSRQAVKRLTLGGGTFSGALGQHLYQSALSCLERDSLVAIELVLPPKPRELSLRGAAQSFDHGTVAILDAGHTAIKRGIGLVQNGRLEQLETSAPLSIALDLTDAERILHLLLETLLEQAHSAESVTQFALSLSVNLEPDGNVSRAFGSGTFYSPLVQFNLVDELEKRLSERLGYGCTVNVMHEGQAAINADLGSDAVILLGTSVGGGLRGGFTNLE